MLDWTLHLLNHPWIPWAAVGFLLFWGSGHWIAMQRNFFWPLHRQLFEARQQLEETPEEPIAFAAHYHEVERTLSRFRLLAPSWTAFSRTLFFSSRGMALQGSREPRHFLSATALMGGESSRYYYHTVPSLLLGVGVLFTLIGLVAAIRFTILGMASNDLYAAQNALQGLLNAASLKFLSSIVGFAIAVLFSWEEKRQSHILGQEAERFCQLLLERISFVGGAEIRREQLRESQAQSKHLKEISDRLNQTVTQPMFQQSAGKQSGDASSDILFQRFATQFEGAMGHFRETLDDLGKTLKTVSAPLPDLQSLIKSIQGEGERLIHANETALARLFEGVNRQLSSLHVDTSLAELQPAERTELLDRLADRMEAAVVNLGDAGLSPFQSIATQIEKAIIALESRATEHQDAVTLPDIERLIGALREEGERIWAANAWNSEKYGVEPLQENPLPLQTVYSGEQTDLLERIASQMEQVVVGFGQQAGSQTDVSPVFQEQTALLERIAKQMEQAVTVLIATAGGTHLDADAQSDLLERSARMERAVVASLVAKAESFNSLEALQPLLKSVQQESERLIQANTAAMEKLLDGVQQQFANMQTEAVMSALLPDERTRMMDHLATRMETVISHLGTAGFSPFDRIATQLEKAVLALEERSVPSATVPDMQPIVEALREEGARIVAANESVIERMAAGISRHGALGLSDDPHSREQSVILEHVAAQIERAIVTLGEKVESSSSQTRMEALLEGMRQEGERLVRANEEAMQGILEVITHRFTEVTATATLSELAPEERSGLLERVASRMEQAVSSLGEVGLSPFFEEIRREMAQVTGVGAQAVNEGILESFSLMTRQLDGVVAALESKVWAADVVPDMTPLVRAIRQEGERLLMANDHAMDRLLTEVIQRVPAVAISPEPNHSAAILSHIAVQLEKISQALSDKFAASSTNLSDLEPLFSRIQREGERLVQANQQSMAGLLDEVARRFTGVTASSALAELHPNERSELLDGVAMRMDRAVASLGALGLTPFLDGMRQEVEQLVRGNQQAVSRLVEEIAQRTREGNQEVQWMERAVTQLSNAIAQMGQKLSTVLSPSSDSHRMPDAWIVTVQREADRLHENHQRLFTQLEHLLELVATIPSSTVVSPPPMGEIVAVLDEQSLRPLIDGWRQEGERMVMASEMAFERLLEEVGQRLSHARVGEEMALFERLSMQLDRSLQVVTASIPLKDPAPTDEESTVEPLKQEINRITVSETSAILAPFLSEMTQIISRQRNEEMRMMKHVATEVNRSVAALDAKIGRATPLNLKTLVNTVHEQGEKLFASSQQILQQLQRETTPMIPALAEMIHAVSQQRGEEMRLLERVATEVNRSVAALDAKIGRATPLDLKTLVHTVRDQGEKICASGRDVVRALQAGQGDRLESHLEEIPVPKITVPTDRSTPKGAPPADLPSGMTLSPIDTSTRVVPATDPEKSRALPTGNEGLHALLAQLPVRSASKSNNIPTQSVVNHDTSPLPSKRTFPQIDTSALVVSATAPEENTPEESDTLPTDNEGLHALLARLPVRPASMRNGIPTRPVVNHETAPVLVPEEESALLPVPEVEKAEVRSDSAVVPAPASASLSSHPWVQQTPSPAVVPASTSASLLSHPWVQQAPSPTPSIMRPTKVGFSHMPWVSMATDRLASEIEAVALPTVSDLLPKLLANRGPKKSTEVVATPLLALTDRSQLPAGKGSTLTVTNPLDVQPLVPKLVGDFRDRRKQPRMPFIEFVEHQTADFFDSQARFSLLKP